MNNPSDFFTGMIYVAIVVWAFPGLGHANDLQAGKIKAEMVCQTCHGMDGIGNIAMVPNIAGQKEDYMKIQLEAYRAGKRQHLQMSTIAQSLSDDDIRQVSKWYASIGITITMPE